MVCDRTPENLEIPGLFLGAKFNLNFVASNRPGMTLELHSEPLVAGKTP